MTLARNDSTVSMRSVAGSRSAVAIVPVGKCTTRRSTNRAGHPAVRTSLTSHVSVQGSVSIFMGAA